MDNYNIQSYFKELCKTYCVAYDQLKRTKKELSYLKDENISDEEYTSWKDSLEKDETFWIKATKSQLREIERVLYIMTYAGQTIIVNSREEIIVLATFFYVNGIAKHKVINTDEKYLKNFPANNEFYIDFFAAYCTEDETQMDKVYHKYIG